MFVEHADPAVAVTKRHQLLAEEANAHRRAIALGNLFDKAGRHPMPAHQLAYRGVAGHAAQELVFFPGHRSPPAGANASTPRGLIILRSLS
jgi:hypothetical protein